MKVNKVPRSEGAVPVMNLPQTLPSDIDHVFYVREAISLLADIGHFGKSPVKRVSRAKPTREKLAAWMVSI